MNKGILFIMVLILMFPVVLSIEECKGSITTEEIPCYLLLPVNTTLTNCGTLGVQIYNETTNIYNQTMSTYNSFLCNATFNQSNVGTYTIYYTSGDSASIIIEEGDGMILFGIMLIFLFFIGAVIVTLFFVEKIWVKVTLSILLSILIMSLTRFMSWFVSIKYPTQLELINTLDHFYMFGVWGFRTIMMVSPLIIIILIFNGLKNSKRKKQDTFGDWEE